MNIFVLRAHLPLLQLIIINFIESKDPYLIIIHKSFLCFI